MPTISVITAVLAGKHHFLTETYHSLLAQHLPAGWGWQWVVQEDGETGLVAQLPDDPRVSPGSAKRGLAAVARTLALGRAEGVLVRALDADDVLLPGALARDIEALVNRPELGWCVSPALDLLTDGGTRSCPDDPPPGALAPGWLAEEKRRSAIPVVPTSMTAYTELVEIMGGWQAMPGTEDVALLLACEAVAPGWMLDVPSLLYRKWPGQTTAHPAWSPTNLAAAARSRIVLRRADALRAAGWRWSAPALPRS